MDSSKDNSSKNQSQESLKDTVRGLRHLLLLLEQTEERMSLESRSISIQIDVVKQLIEELDDTSNLMRQANVFISRELSNYQTDNL